MDNVPYQERSSELEASAEADRDPRPRAWSGAMASPAPGGGVLNESPPPASLWAFAPPPGRSGRNFSLPPRSLQLGGMGCGHLPSRPGPHSRAPDIPTSEHCPRFHRGPRPGAPLAAATVAPSVPLPLVIGRGALRDRRGGPKDQKEARSHKTSSSLREGAQLYNMSTKVQTGNRELSS